MVLLLHSEHGAVLRLANQIRILLIPLIKRTNDALVVRLWRLRHVRRPARPLKRLVRDAAFVGVRVIQVVGVIL